MTRFAALVLVVVLGASGAFAQRRAAAVASHPSPVDHGSFAPAVRHSTRVFVGNGFGYRRSHRYGSLYGWPYVADYGYDGEPPDYTYEYPRPEREPEAAPQPAPAVPTSPPSPLLLELHGDQWVQVGNFTTPSGQTQTEKMQYQPGKEIPPAVLVFRDGHSEEISSYSIIGPVIYTKADYWSSGSWTRKIQIADLDLPATLKHNQQRGVKFELPSGPSEVMLRP
jgi:hypothetical protein